MRGNWVRGRGRPQLGRPGSKPCRHEAKRKGSCNYGTNCTYSHDLTQFSKRELDEVLGSSPKRTNSGQSSILAPPPTLATLNVRAYTFEESRRIIAAAGAEEGAFNKPREGEVFVTALLSSLAWKDRKDQETIFSLVADDANVRAKIEGVLTSSDISLSAGASLTAVSFQRTFMGIFKYLASEVVSRSVAQSKSNALYAILHRSMDPIVQNTTSHLQALLVVRSCQDKELSPVRANSLVYVPTSYQDFFVSIVEVFTQYLTRFKDGLVQHLGLKTALRAVADAFLEWQRLIAAGSVQDSLRDAEEAQRRFVMEQQQGAVARLLSLSQTEHVLVNNAQVSAIAEDVQSKARAILAHLNMRYDPPTECREKKPPRHDNDRAHIADISIMPTHAELVCSEAPFLPANMLGAPHHLPPGTLDRQVDVHFRLLREDFIAPLRNIVGLLSWHHEKIAQGRPGSKQLAQLCRDQGGRYKAGPEDQAADFNLYTSAEPIGMSFQDGILVHIRVAAPPGDARSDRANRRKTYWELATQRRTLVYGGIVCFVWTAASGSPQYFVGEVKSRPDEIIKSSTPYSCTAKIRFFQGHVNFYMEDHIAQRHDGNGGSRHLLVEPPTSIYGTIAPFLKQLQVLDPALMPFGDYIGRSNLLSLRDCEIQPPLFSRSPAFRYDLQCLYKPEHAGDGPLRLITTNKQSIDNARTILKGCSYLDESQVDCLIDVLTQELSLVQGPPGTGKSFLGIQLVKVLRANDIGPILCIAATNHAIDTFLEGIVPISDKLVRLGSRSSNPEISKYNIEEKIHAQPPAPQQRRADFWEARQERNELAAELEDAVRLLGQPGLQVDVFLRLLSQQNSELHFTLMEPPVYITHAWQYSRKAGVWQTVSRSKSGQPLLFSDSVHAPLLAWWLQGGDIDVFEEGLQAASREHFESAHSSSSSSGSDVENLFAQGNRSAKSNFDPPESSPDWKFAELDDLTWWDDVEVSDDIETNSQSDTAADNETATLEPDDTLTADPAALTPQRSVSDIFPQGHSYRTNNLDASAILDRLDDAWQLSAQERQNLFRHLRRTAVEDASHRFTALEVKYRKVEEKIQEFRAEDRAEIVREAHVIGSTTNGAAKYAALLAAVRPKVVIIEEAGQVLEAHALASLSRSVELMVCIGDPLQLRPSVSNYSLSMDSRSGRALALDKSLMERLSGEAEFPMESLLVQRRMQPEVSTLIKPLYPNLQDHPIVTTERRPLRGFKLPTGTFFLNHGFRESTHELSSKANDYEAAMVKDIVLHLFKQGYDKPGDIAIVTGYLGQLHKIRQYLAGAVEVIVDERDQDGNEDLPIAVRQVEVDKQVLIRTVDNYQGEEANIIILSLVRNSGSGAIAEDILDALSNFKPSIGFLKSSNRTNVALSRAREGMIILGEAAAMRQSPLWAHALDHLDSQGALGDALPLSCANHPEWTSFISKPGELPNHSPDGGCLLPCSRQLLCGHLCPFKCHPLGNDPDHRASRCQQPCMSRLSCGHPCNKICAAPCDELACREPIAEVLLPCGHIKKRVPCGAAKNIESIRCVEMVVKPLPTCEHLQQMLCNTDPATATCQAICHGQLSCCSSICKATCGKCQQLSRSQADLDANDDEAEVGAAPSYSRIPRHKHQSHACDRLMYCQHRCKAHCGHNHEAETCSQHVYLLCEHRERTQKCGTIAAPCQAPACTTQCSHGHQCDLICGFPCSATPCNQDCTTLLICGHVCNSTCGETCFCRECASNDEKEQVVDFIEGATLASAAGKPVIRLGCGHIFTRETLDGHLHMSDFYVLDAQDLPFKRKAQLPEGFLRFPTCPVCRTAITGTERYKAIIKRAFLDLQERNYFHSSNQSLARISEALGRSGVAIEPSMFEGIAIGKLDSFSAGDLRSIRNALILPKIGRKIIQVKDLASSFTKTLPKPLQSVWQDRTRKLFVLHQQLVDLVARQPPHKAAYDAAWVTIYRREKERVAKMRRPPHDEEAYCRRETMRALGAPPPRSDERRFITSVLLALDIRRQLIPLTQLVIDKIATLKQSGSLVTIWRTYQDHLLAAGLRDLREAIEAAVASESARQLKKCALWRLQYNFLSLQRKFSRTVLKSDEYRREAAAMILTKRAAALADFNETIDRLPLCRGLVSMDDTYSSQLQSTIDAFDDLQRQALSATYYETVTDRERMMVLEALLQSNEFSSTAGHAYRCQNGHTFFIGECGGAMQEAGCPECGVTIGGRSHRLAEGNSADIDMERLARRMGRM